MGYGLQIIKEKDHKFSCWDSIKVYNKDILAKAFWYIICRYILKYKYGVTGISSLFIPLKDKIYTNRSQTKCRFKQNTRHNAKILLVNKYRSQIDQGDIFTPISFSKFEILRYIIYGF